jgi:hypothetical protein
MRVDGLVPFDGEIYRLLFLKHFSRVSLIFIQNFLTMYPSLRNSKKSLFFLKYFNFGKQIFASDKI